LSFTYDHAGRLVATACTDGLLAGVTVTNHFDPARGRDSLRVLGLSSGITNNYAYDTWNGSSFAVSATNKFVYDRAAKQSTPRLGAPSVRCRDAASLTADSISVVNIPVVTRVSLAETKVPPGLLLWGMRWSSQKETEPEGLALLRYPLERMVVAFVAGEVGAET